MMILDLKKSILKMISQIRRFCALILVTGRLIRRSSRDTKRNLRMRSYLCLMTMQNHGSYVKRYSNFIPDVSILGGKGTYLKATEQYLSLIKRSDEAFKQLAGIF